MPFWARYLVESKKALKVLGPGFAAAACGIIPGTAPAAVAPGGTMAPVGVPAGGIRVEGFAAVFLLFFEGAQPTKSSADKHSFSGNVKRI